MIYTRRSERKCHKAPRSQSPDRYVFSSRLNCPRLSHCRIDGLATCSTDVVRQPQNTGRRNFIFERRTTQVAVLLMYNVGISIALN